MAKKSATPLMAKRVWRISASAPMGEYVDPEPLRRREPKPERLAVPEVTHGGWIESSFDLLRGAEVTEHVGGFAAEQDEFSRIFSDDAWRDTQVPEFGETGLRSEKGQVK